ncbi:MULTISPECIES: hypothetical protein [unclassified Sphingobacterium]|uniref:hypothetical protein n=1 Tax=unclassified Sphingobacterium TaxID=2609468 RepID=UPI0025FAD989|nr:MULTISPECIES: hypothetical protein [unclassified Sphingobacterium]
MHDLDRLKTLIGLYQKEAKDLKKFISTCLNDWDYMIADHYAQRLGQVNRELQILQTILDPNYGDKQILIRQIAHYKKNRSLPGQKDLRELYGRWIRDAEEKLKWLNNLTVPESPFSKTLEEILEKLTRKEVRKVVLMLNSEHDLGIIITRGRKLMLRIPKIKTLRSKSAIWDYQIDLLEKVGFQWDSKETLLSLELEPNNSTKPVMEYLSRIVFKVFTFEEMKGKSYISYC